RCLSANTWYRSARPASRAKAPTSRCCVTARWSPSANRARRRRRRRGGSGGEGTAVAVLCYGAMVPVCEQAAEEAQQQGRSVEIVDLRTLVPLDEQAVIDSVKNTGRCGVVSEAPT